MFVFYINLNKGQSFGELALTSNKGRAARITCSQDCVFGVITKKEYQQIMNTNYLKEVAHKIHILKNFQIF
jgi:CRP-like cAMP-binding protein